MLTRLSLLRLRTRCPIAPPKHLLLQLSFAEPLLFCLTNFLYEFPVIEVCFCSHNGLNSDIAPCPKSSKPNSDMTLIRPQKKKPPRRRLFNTGRCGVGQRFSHVERDRRNERPQSHHRVRLRRLRRSRARLRSLLRLRRARFIREHPTCPSTSRGICEATLSW